MLTLGNAGGRGGEGQPNVMLVFIRGGQLL